MNAVVIASTIRAGDVVTGTPTQIKLMVAVSLKPIDGSIGLDDELVITRDIASTAAQWKTDILNAITTWAAAPPSAPAGLWTAVRVIGLIDLSTVAV